MTKIYAGIGSRKTPKSVLLTMKDIAERLGINGCHLRSGGAMGADRAFHLGAITVGSQASIYRPDGDWKAEPWMLDALRSVAWECPPERMSHVSLRLLLRNMMQIMGPDGNHPADFVVCWTPTLSPVDPGAGGTRYACRLAIKMGIPVFNLRNESDHESLIRVMDDLTHNRRLREAAPGKAPKDSP